MKKEVAICINDPHIGKDTIQAFKDNWNECMGIAVSRKIKYILVGGDMFLSRVSQTLSILLTVQECLQEASDAGLIVILEPGNHDKVDQEDVRSYCHIFKGINNVIVVDEHMAVTPPDSDVAIHMMPYFPETGSFKERLKRVELIEDKKNLLYCHQGINGGLAHSDDSSNKELPTHIFKRFDATLVAHYHNRVRLEGTNIYYIGSSRQHNFGEDTEKGYTIINNDGSFDFVENQINTRYITFEGQFDDIDKAFMSEIAETKEEGFRVRVIIHCKSTQRKLINKSDFVKAGAAKVDIKEEKVDENGVKVKSSSGSLRFNKEGIKTSYIKFCEDKGIEDPEFGLDCIDRINI